MQASEQMGALLLAHADKAFTNRPEKVSVVFVGPETLTDVAAFRNHADKPQAADARVEFSAVEPVSFAEGLAFGIRTPEEKWR